MNILQIFHYEDHLKIPRKNHTIKNINFFPHQNHGLSKHKLCHYHKRDLTQKKRFKCLIYDIYKPVNFIFYFNVYISNGRHNMKVPIGYTIQHMELSIYDKFS